MNDLQPMIPEPTAPTLNKSVLIPRARRKRTGRKRTKFRPPARFPQPVSELWKQASEEERRRAHLVCVGILEYWLGKKSKAEVAEDLGMPLLRVWQLSQAALSGMLAGLLKQPRAHPGRPPQWSGEPSDDPKRLRKRIAELELCLSRTEDLVRVLRTAPWTAPNAAPNAAVDAELNAKPTRKPKGGGQRDGSTSTRRSRRVAQKRAPTRSKKAAASEPRAEDPRGDGVEAAGSES